MTEALLPLTVVVAGILSITSPCCLPMVPAYVSYISTTTNGDGEGAGTGTALRASVLFVAGFTVVFVALGMTASRLGALLLANLPTITRVSGVFVIALGLGALGLFRIPWLAREWRPGLAGRRRGPAGAVPMGMAFAFGWTPCIGPVLAGVLALAAGSGSVVVGAVLLALYSIGLGLPFVGIAVGYRRLSRTLTFLRRHGRAVERLGGVLLVGVGIGYVTDTWSRLFVPMQAWFAQWGWPPL
jgi:cytochrome c-type biogenesis protein